MKFDDYFINAEDWEFFVSLPSDEQILFIHDLVCEEYYGKGSIDDAEKETIKLDNFTEFLESVSNKISNSNQSVSVLYINKHLVFNSESLHLLYDAIVSYFENGYILTRIDMSKPVTKLFHRMRYCEMYLILGIENKISLN